MLHIKEFLQKFEKLAPPEKHIKEMAIETIFQHTGARLEPPMVRISNGALFLSAPAALKSEIFMRKKEILQELKITLGDKAPREVW